MIAGEQVTKARALLGWSIVDLARWSGLDRILILTFELGELRLETTDAEQLMSALERAGIAFTDVGLSGVRLKSVKQRPITFAAAKIDDDPESRGEL
jgi:hypothetical protein